MGERVPQHVQNIIIRNYCEQNNFQYLLSSTEYVYEKSDIMLEQALNEIKNLDGIISYSLFQLPEDDDKRNRIYNIILKERKEFHFAVEGLKLTNSIETELIEYLWLIKKTIPMCPKNLSLIKKI
jgi:sporadic carbohydrate cluster protein (TIGR04323 family)